MAYVWMDTENVEELGNKPLEMFEAVGYVSDTDAERPTGELIICRGTQRKGDRGINWSISGEVAEWFARRWARSSATSWLTIGKVRGEDVLAYLTSRGEEEIVVNPKNVRVIREERLPFRTPVKLKNKSRRRSNVGTRTSIFSLIGSEILFA